MTERRNRRSDIRAEALGLFLESQRTQLRLRRVTVTMADGRMLAGAGPSPERLARQVPLVDVAGSHVATWRMRADGVEVVLAAEGGRLSHELGIGVRRILAS
jgi:hypothetical protein